MTRGVPTQRVAQTSRPLTALDFSPAAGSLALPDRRKDPKRSKGRHREPGPTCDAVPDWPEGTTYLR